MMMQPSDLDQLLLKALFNLKQGGVGVLNSGSIVYTPNAGTVEKTALFMR